MKRGGGCNPLSLMISDRGSVTPLQAPSPLPPLLALQVKLGLYQQSAQQSHLIIKGRI